MKERNLERQRIMEKEEDMSERDSSWKGEGRDNRKKKREREGKEEEDRKTRRKC